MRIACMVLPQGLLERYQSDFSMYANTVSRYEQQTLCEFMANGYFARHIARMRLTYKRRMEAFAAALHAGLDPDLTLAGTHLVYIFCSHYRARAANRPWCRPRPNKGCG